MIACIFVRHNFSCSMRIYKTLFFPPHFERDALWSKGKLDFKFSFFKKTFNEHM